MDGNDTFNGDPAGCLAATTDGTEADFMGGGEGNDIFNGDGTGNPASTRSPTAPLYGSGGFRRGAVCRIGQSRGQRHLR